VYYTCSSGYLCLEGLNYFLKVIGL
jgi:hypothetical protein